MPPPANILIMFISSSTAMIGLAPVTVQARNIDLDFYRLTPGMEAKDVSAILGEPLPKSCHAKGNELAFESESGAYKIYLDSHGHFFRMTWQQKRPAPLMTEDAFRTLAELHKCGAGKSFEIEKNTGMFRSGTAPMTPEKTHEGFTAKFQGHDHIQLILSLSRHSKNEYHLSCFRLKKASRARFEDSCNRDMMPCPSPSPFPFLRGLRF